MLYSQARIVAVFYGESWGKTPFTRIEETAIRNRAFAEGFDFTVFIPTEKPPATPKWLPKPRLYHGLERFGLDGAAAVIEARIQEAGGEPSDESVEDRANRFQRATALRSQKQQFRKSEASVAAHGAFGDLISIIGTELGASGLQASIDALRGERDFYLLRMPGVVATINWRSRYANDLDESELVVAVYNGMPKLSGLNHFPAMRPVRQLASMNYDYALLRSGVGGYVDRQKVGMEFDPNALAKAVLKKVIDLAEANPR
ncbi:hypothetical protein [Mesorhizobium sp.]|uniref:hypothetical protein n=1 Tax=Mesorhizobium sp. TaxID=1871066 RepID=UPI000FE90244|nr:hypothetical protein [Mesorhizobium sp.]RWI99960.1 MAG: hypothetical protein EOR23_31880 [Mesorhizobium sp.]RWM04956.1 MAG: hypothetical protein EOR71_25525 [Mesorhizobium sp.]RWO82154.1 MAG: hypothetical protein EOQ95_27570 [Mesorhizobium sp.]